MKTTKQETKQEAVTTKKYEKATEKCAVLFHRTSKNGTSYLSGSAEGGAVELVGFYNTQKKNPKQPDIEIYERLEEGHSKEALIVLWTKEKCATGYDNEKRKVVAFFNTSKDNQYKILNIYYQKGE